MLQVKFEDLDNNGQVIQNLETLTTRIKCANLNFDVKGNTFLFFTFLKGRKTPEDQWSCKRSSDIRPGITTIVKFNQI